MLKLIKRNLFRNMDNFEIDLNELEIKQLEGAILVDVRSPQEYHEGHLKGAINIPYYEITKNAYKYLANKERGIIVYCQYGQRSRNALKTLRKLGYRDVYSLTGGIENI